MLKGSKQKALSGSGNKNKGKELAQSASSGAKDTNIPQQPSAIELLSDEILCAIFGCLDDGIDLCAVGLVSQAWHRLAHDDTLWKGLAVKRGWALPAELPGGGGAEAEAGADGEDSSSLAKTAAAAKGGKRSKDHQRHRLRASLQRAKAKQTGDDSYLTKGRTVDDGDDNDHDYRDGDGGGVVGGRWKEWYVQTLHRRVKRSMRECGDDEEARWRHIANDDADDDDGNGDDQRDNEDDDDGDDDDVGKRQLRREAQNRREAAAERIGSSGKLNTAASSREDFVQLVKEKAARSLTKVEIREQEVVLAQFAWDRPVQQFGANQDDLYIVGGTPWGLVNYMLTELSSHDDPMVTQFLLTHQSFVSSVEVLRMLEEYLCIMPRGYSRDYQFLWRKHKLAPVQNMVVHVVKCWIKEQPCHFREDPVLAARMQEFLESHLTFHPLEKAFHQLLQQYIAAVKPTDPPRRVVITPRVHSTAVATATATAAPTASTEGKENDKEKGKEKESGEKGDEGEPEAGGGEGPNWRVIDLHKTRHVCACMECAKKIARQMALIAFDLFAQLPHDELLNMRWKHQPNTCPNVRQLVDFFNMVAGYVATTIVTERSMKLRVKMLEKWVDIAHHSFKIQDLTSTLAIVSGLGCAAVHRLKKTRQNMSKSAVKTLEALTQTSTRRRLRAIAETMTPPGVPYLGMHLVDLSFVHDGYTPFLNMDWGDKTCVHWYYHCMNALVIKEMQSFIKTGFHFKRDPALIETLCSLPYLATEDAYRHSLAVDETIEQ